MVVDEPGALALLLPGRPSDPLAHRRGAHAELHGGLVLGQAFGEQVDDFPALRTAPPQKAHIEQQCALGILSVSVASALLKSGQARVRTETHSQLSGPGVGRLDGHAGGPERRTSPCPRGGRQWQLDRTDPDPDAPAAVPDEALDDAEDGFGFVGDPLYLVAGRALEGPRRGGLGLIQGPQR